MDNNEKLKQKLTELQQEKVGFEIQLSQVLASTDVSKKGFRRVIKALARFPEDVAKTLPTGEELAIYTISTAIREKQILMTMVATEISNTEVEGVTENVEKQ